MKTVLIYSGGMDSTVLLYGLVKEHGKENVRAISFNYQSKHNDREFKSAVNTCDSLGVQLDRIDLSEVSKHLTSDLLKTGAEIPEGHYAESNMKKTVVPFRNGIMLSIACAIAESCGAENVAIGNHAGDHAVYPDCRVNFVKAMSRATELGTYEEIYIRSPFQELLKEQICTLGNTLEVNWTGTYSCYKGDEVHCGRCSTCFERREAFVNAQVYDPTEYADKTEFKELEKQYNERLKNDNSN